MTDKTLSIGTKIHFNEKVHAAKLFNFNSEQDELGYILIPFPFRPMGETTKPFDEYLDFLENRKPDLTIDNLVAGNYLEEFLLHNNYTDYNFITVAKLPRRCLRLINHATIEIYPIGHRREISQDDFDTFEKYGLKFGN